MSDNIILRIVDFISVSEVGKGFESIPILYQLSIDSF
jgi:hypothetical protein